MNSMSRKSGRKSLGPICRSEQAEPAPIITDTERETRIARILTNLGTEFNRKDSKQAEREGGFLRRDAEGYGRSFRSGNRMRSRESAESQNLLTSIPTTEDHCNA